MRWNGKKVRIFKYTAYGRGWCIVFYCCATHQGVPCESNWKTWGIAWDRASAHAKLVHGAKL